MPGKERNVKVVQATFTIEEKKELEDIAKLVGVTVPELFKRFVREGMRNTAYLFE